MELDWPGWMDVMLGPGPHDTHAEQAERAAVRPCVFLWHLLGHKFAELTLAILEDTDREV